MLVFSFNISSIRGRSSYHEVEERDEDNNRPWSNVINNIRNINFLNAHSQRKYVAVVMFCKHI